MTRFFLAACLCAWFVAADGTAQDLEQRRDAVQEFKRYFPRYRTTAERVAAVQTLEGMECLEAVRALMTCMGDRDPEVALAALAVLRTYREPESFAPMLEALPETKDETRQIAIVQVLAGAGQKQAVPVLGAMVTGKGRSGAALRYEVARALGQLGTAAADGLVAAVAELLGDRDALVRMAAADTAGVTRATSLNDALTPLLEDPAWQVQSSAVAALGKLRQPAAVVPLIDAMERGGRLKQEAADALFEITALDFGVDADMWRRQWTRLQEIGWRIPTDAELAKAREARQRSDAYYGKVEETNAFAGIRTTSTRVLFIIDVSGSMDDLVVERERFPGLDDFRKLSIVKSELTKTIDGLTGQTLFNIVAFATELDSWKKGLVRANIVNRSSAKSWVKRLSPLGGREAQELAGAGLGGSANLAAGKTNTFAALMYPFSVDPERPPTGPMTHGKASIKNKLDTVFFLSDGRPSTGRLVDTGEILAEVNRLNELFKITFHSIAIGDFQKAFLRDLATGNDGVFVDLGR